MNETDVLNVFHDQKKLFDLVLSLFPDAGLTEQVFAAILEDAKASDVVEMRYLWPQGEHSEASKANLILQANCEKRTLYALTTTHHRTQPFHSSFVEECQGVRISLAATRAEAYGIWTHLGLVKPDDHKIFSVEEVSAHYQAAFDKAPPAFSRVDLITGGRYLDLVRFAPISIFLAYENEQSETPLFYFLESGSVTGRPEVLYYASQMGESILAHAGFAFTPFACAQNWYDGLLTMTACGKEPACLAIPISQEKDGQRHYLTVEVNYSIIEPGQVIFPGAQMIIAVMRVFALGLGLQLDRGLIGRAMGKWCLDRTEWEVKPPLDGKADGYCGCPQEQA